jgi:hypothetical protein
VFGGPVLRAKGSLPASQPDQKSGGAAKLHERDLHKEGRMRGRKWGTDQSDRPRRGRWSQAEIARLKDLYGRKPLGQISKELNRPTASIERMAESLFPPGDRDGPWDDAEADRLKRYLGVCDVDTIARIFARTTESVEAHLEALDRNQVERPWSQEELSDLKRLHGTRTDRDIARVFQRPVSSVSAKAAELCLAKDKAFVRKTADQHAAPTRMPRWSADEIETLRGLYAQNSNLDIAQKLARSVKSVVSKAHSLGLRKDHSRLVEMGIKNVSLRYDRKATEESGAQNESAMPGDMDT